MDIPEYEKIKDYLGEEEIKNLEGTLAKCEIRDGAIVITTPGVKTIIPRPYFYDEYDY